MQQSATQWPQRVPATEGWRVHAPFSIPDAPPSGEGAEREWARLCAESAALGFDTLWVPAERLDGAVDAGWEHCAPACARAGLRLLIDDGAADHGLPEPRGGLVRLLERLPAEAAVAVLLRGTGTRRSEGWDELIDALREVRSDLSITIWTPGMAPAGLARLEGRGIDAVYSSLPWWDLRAAWLVEEHERLRAIAPVIAPLADPRAPRALPFDELLRGLAVASVAAEGVLVPGMPPGGASRDLFTQALGDVPAGGTLPEEGGHGPRRLTGPLSAITALFRAEGGGRLLLLNPARERAAAVPRGVIEQRLPNGFVMPSTGTGDLEMAAGAWRFAPVGLADYIVEHGMTSGQLRRSLSTALRAPRIAIEAVRPTVDGGAFPVKRGLGETVVVRADIFMDGHEELAAEVLWRAVNDTVWRRTPMAALGNDAWEARITPRRLGRYVYAIAAWLDRWGGFCVSLRKKSEAGVDVSLEVEEGRRMLAACLEQAAEKNAGPAETVRAALKAVGAPLEADPAPRRRRKRAMTAPSPEQVESAEATPVPQATPGQVAVLLDAALADAVRRLDERAFETHTSLHYPLSIERGEAMFSSWYELFPRSQSPEAGRHGTLRDVMRRLPGIRRMGFDVLYFPPIHPIGRQNRKGRNNSLRAAPGDPGSPYAIGGPEGGHDALHPELGTLDDFRELVKAAQRHGLEIALDFAIQCSPDHPWLRENPDWFNWRADGSLKHAENPPKRYEDIVNPDFYSPLASSPRQAALWRALRDIVLFWVRQGVRIFRVDNPHTKPLPFWQWLLREVRDRHPDTLFLSEAFTRPAMMYRLAKLGFSQSYTYFTWRNTRDELAAYMTELNRPPVSDFFRPNFFVNTPDINPWFLQTSGRAGFLIRAVLAGTLSGSWGMYNGFELCEARAVPGKEEYLDSEKYQLRQWDMDAPGNIVEEISRLNRIRRSHPALQSHLGIRFHESGNDQVLFYSRHSAAGDSTVLAAVSLDPHRAQAARLELPRPEWGLGGDAPLHLHDLFEDHHFVLRDGFHTIELTPERPFVLWALASDEGGAA